MTAYTCAMTDTEYAAYRAEKDYENLGGRLVELERFAILVGPRMQELERRLSELEPSG